MVARRICGIRGAERRRGVIGRWWSEYSDVHHEKRRGLFVNEDEACQLFICESTIAVGTS